MAASRKFSTAAELLERLSEWNMDLPDFVVARDAADSGLSGEEIRAEVAHRIGVTRHALERGIGEPQKSFSGMTDGAACRFLNAASLPAGDEFFRLAVGYSLAVNEVNACGGRIVAFPTAGSCGIIPGVLWAWRDAREPSLGPESKRFQDAFITAAAVGILVATGSSIAGATGGCQAECGAAAAMAAAGLASLQGTGAAGVFNAAALSLKNSLGLACDPVAGLVEVPCVKRNGFMAANALVAASMQAAGITSVIPFDEVVSAMKSIGDAMPSSLKESSEGGLALTPTGLSYRNRISGA